MYKTVALFGANGNIGNPILHALTACKKRSFTIRAFIPPKSTLKYSGGGGDITTFSPDLASVSTQELAPFLEGVDVVVSAVGSALLPRQHVIQDAAAQAGVRRFYISEFGMQQVLRLPGVEVGVVHPVGARLLASLASTASIGSAAVARRADAVGAVRCEPG